MGHERNPIVDTAQKGFQSAAEEEPPCPPTYPGIAGNFSSAVFENPCELVVGASGCIFGLIGLYIADIILNFESLALPWLRLGTMIVALVFVIVSQVRTWKLKTWVNYRLAQVNVEGSFLLLGGSSVTSATHKASCKYLLSS